MKKYILSSLTFLFVFSLILAPELSYGLVSNVAGSECVIIQNNLRYRDRDVNKNGEVTVLQDFLQAGGYLNTDPTGYFGMLTFKAVKDFQDANDIVPVSGYVGPITRAKIEDSTCNGVVVDNTSSRCLPGHTYDMKTGVLCSTGTTYPVISGITGPTSLMVNQIGTWTVTASNSAGGNLSYSVDWGDRSAISTATSSPTTLSQNQSATFTHTYLTSSTSYSLTFKVTNQSGKSVQRVLTANVTNTTGGGGGGGGGGSGGGGGGGGTNIPVVTISASPITITLGQSSRLSWSVSNNPTTCTLTGAGGVASTGTRDVFPTSSAIYTMNCTNSSGSGSNSVTVNVTATLPVAPTVSISANPTSTVSGQSSVLTWSSTNATSCLASGGWSGNKAISGSETVSPISNTNYGMTCTGAGGSATNQATVTVSTRPPTATSLVVYQNGLQTGWSDFGFWGTTSINYDSTAKPDPSLTSSKSIEVAYQAWGGMQLGYSQALTSADYSSVKLRVWSPVSGSVAVKLMDTNNSSLPVVSKTVEAGWRDVSFTMAELNPTGASFSFFFIQNYTSGSNTLYVSDIEFLRTGGGSGPTLSLGASPTSITLGQSSTLTWSSTGVTSCTASGEWSGTKATSGNQTVTPSTIGQKTYTLACGALTQSTTVNVSNVSSPTLSLGASPASITLGQSSTLTWSSTGVTSCTATGEWSGTKATSGNQTVTPTTIGQKTYTLACGALTQSTTVNVSNGNPPSATNGPLDKVAASQIGYAPSMKKEFSSPFPFDSFVVQNLSGGANFNGGAPNNIVTTNGIISPTGQSKTVWWGDFSGLTTAGHYKIIVKNNGTATGESFPFDIGNNLFDNPVRAVARWFYYQRAFTAVEMPYAEGPWVHPSDTQWQPVNTYNGLPMKAWHDAGDLNVYMPTLSKAIYWLLESYVDWNATDDNFNIPESGNGIPDILDEAKWGLDGVLAMEDVGGGFHDEACINGVTDVPYPPGILPNNVTGNYILTNITTSNSARATAILAQGSKVFRDIGQTAYADQLKAAAVRGWNWVQAHPAQYTAGNGCVNYHNAGDDNAQKAKMWAAAALFYATGDAQYNTWFNTYYADPGGVGSYANDAPYAAQLYLRTAGGTHTQEIRNLITSSAGENTSTPFNWFNYGQWGSINDANHAAAQWPWRTWLLSNRTDTAARNSAMNATNYMLGRNSWDFVYISGIPGTSRGMQEVFSQFAERVNGTPHDWPGMVGGGPNASAYDSGEYGTSHSYYGDTRPCRADGFCFQRDPSTPLDMKYNDNDSWTTNEPTVHWQSSALYNLLGARAASR